MSDQPKVILGGRNRGASASAAVIKVMAEHGGLLDWANSSHRDGQHYVFRMRSGKVGLSVIDEGDGLGEIAVMRSDWVVSPLKVFAQVDVSTAPGFLNFWSGVAQIKMSDLGEVAAWVATL